jgi:tRNA pseudouridine13 synthase
MLKRLARKSDDFIGAFRLLPIKLRRLFPQAYQAYLFNKFLSRRIEKGLPLKRVQAGDYAINVERSGLPMPKMHKTVTTRTLAEISKATQAGKMRLAVPLIGFKQQHSKGVQGEIEKQILQEETISTENFRITAMPETSARGKLRTAITPLNSYLLDGISQDLINPSKHKTQVSFALYRGSYATIVLRELMKPRNLIKAGF